MFCFHYSGGNAQIFREWPTHLPPSVELVAIQLPGRGHRFAEPHIRRLAPLSRVVAQELLPYLDKPFVFFGHSLGALLCFETARSLRRETRRQPALYLFQRLRRLLDEGWRDRFPACRKTSWFKNFLSSMGLLVKGLKTNNC